MSRQRTYPDEFYSKSGHRNDYKIQKYLGRVGSRRDSTWDKEKHMHTCCGGRAPYYHKVGCTAMNGPDDLSDLKDL